MRRLWGTPAVEYLPPAILLVLASGFLAIAYGFNPGSGAMPILVGWAMVGLTALDLVTRLRVPLGDLLARTLNPASLGAVPDPAEPSRLRRQLVVVATLLIYLAGMVLVGVLPTVPVFMLAALRFGAGRGWGFSLVGAGGLVLLVWAVFARLLGLALFPGLLFDGEW